ncbi:Sec-independent protein translocase protein TatB [Halopseudomonas pelagia]|uniref:Sec-independent protein translocase protein TatB n=1 Tax=Halopseudomonas pelagia TaxID=553151 RepID=A0AA91U2T1_9GAMM|nr:Sec-independent protein translocase protein TatB [Halopseudomonas pelagia]PCC99370.1 twin-arginine translocase subunit TatB [Halopseudomonas pelagia]QFY55469.1 twin-arginine translocase subunit TatB [Halopseudomonas pelagia]
MFDVSFLELLVIAVIALVVLGPERLPGFIRTVGLMIGRAKRGFADVRAQVEREIGADEIRQQLHNEKIMSSLEKGGKDQDKNLSKPVSNVKRNSSESVTATDQTTAAVSDQEAALEPTDLTSTADHPGTLDNPDATVAEPQTPHHER